MGRIDGKIAVVTGGASGIGEAVVRRFRAEGAQVVFTDLNETAGAALAAETGAVFQRQDVASEDDWRVVMDLVKTRFGRLDVLFNNAGIVTNKSIEDLDLASWNKILGVNVTGVMLGCKYGVELMKQNSDKAGGSIINTGSTTSFLGLSFDPAYSATKHAVVGLTRSIAASCAKQRLNIRVNSLHPGATYTAILKEHVARDPAMFDVFSAMAPMGRMGEPSEVANMALYLASDESAFSTGAQFLVDGGISNTHPEM